ncbi:helix-turn-helix domain-containing protein [Nonomuraea polychroma]|uniref:helix-turn-helix domain-containing protein n=1 Tax=Nonomuraea polychroma TaxID=46176 RepID=UPI003D8F6BC4
MAAPIAAGSPELVCRAWQLIIDGVLDGGTDAALAGRMGLSPRHLRRLFLRHLGAMPDHLARSRRAHFARRLLDDTDLTVLDVAFASGFGSLWQFNRTMRDIFQTRSPINCCRCVRLFAARQLAEPIKQPAMF